MERKVGGDQRQKNGRATEGSEGSALNVDGKRPNSQGHPTTRLPTNLTHHFWDI